MGVAIFTRNLPFLAPPAMQHSDEECRRFAFLAAAKLLPCITDVTWPGHDKLPKWASLKNDYEAVRPKGMLHTFMSSHPKRLPGGNDEPPKVIVARMLQWDPAMRPLMQDVVEYVEQTFTFPQEDEDEACRKNKQVPASSSDTEGSIEGDTRVRLTKRRSSGSTDGRKSGNLKTIGALGDRKAGLPARKRRCVAGPGNPRQRRWRRRTRPQRLRTLQEIVRRRQSRQFLLSLELVAVSPTKKMANAVGLAANSYVE